MGTHSLVSEGHCRKWQNVRVMYVLPNKLLIRAANAVLHRQCLISGAVKLLLVAATAGLQMHSLLRAYNAVPEKGCIFCT